MVLQGNNPDLTVLPGDIPGVYVLNNTGVKDTAHLQSMSVSVDVAREELFELGKKVSYARPVTFQSKLLVILKSFLPAAIL